MVDPAHKAEPSCPQERARGKLDSERRRAGDEGARAEGRAGAAGKPAPAKTALRPGICDSCQKAAGGEERLGGLRLLSQHVGSQDKHFIEGNLVNGGDAP